MTPNERKWSWKLLTAITCAAAFLSVQAGRWATSAPRTWAVSALSAMMLTTVVSARTPEAQTPARADLNAEIVKAVGCLPARGHRRRRQGSRGDVP